MSVTPQQREVKAGGTKVTFPDALVFDSNMLASGTNTNAVVTLGADSVRPDEVWQVIWSYSATPTGGGLTIGDGTNTFLNIDITASGPGCITFAAPLAGGKNAQLIVTLLAGGSTVVGKLNIVAFKRT